MYPGPSFDIHPFDRLYDDGASHAGASSLSSVESELMSSLTWM